MVSIRRSLAVLLVAILLCGYVPASGIAAGSVGGGGVLDTGDSGDTTEAGTTADKSTEPSSANTPADAQGHDAESLAFEASVIPEDVENETEDTTDDIDDTTGDTDDTTDEVDHTTDEVDDTTDEVDDTTDNVEETADGATDDVDDTTDDVEETVDGATDDATNTTELPEGIDGTTTELLGNVGSTATLDPSDAGAILAVDGVDVAVAVDDGSIDASVTADEDGVEVASSTTDGQEQTEAADREQPADTSPPGEESIDASTDGANDVESGAENPASGDSDSDSGVPLPGDRTSSGIAVSAVLIGAALIARNAGTAAALSALGGSGGSLLATLVSVLRDWAARILGLFGYKRYSDDDPLEHETRERLYECIRDSPGVYLSEITEETGLKMGTARYHLRILEFENLVTSEEIRGRRRYVPVGTEWAELEAALHDETTARIIESLADEGPDSVTGLAERLDRDPSTITHHLDRLAEDGIVERERDGRAVVNKLAEPARIAMADDDAPTVAREPVPSGAD